MDGIIPLWKERGMTSHDCVFKLRKLLKTKKVGHSGTLDPDVDGVLPICIGKGTKVIQYLQDSGKTYIGEITLGFSTTTEDISGDVVKQTPVTSLIPIAEIDQVMKELTGTITQIPPMYSAVKVNGKRLYEYAREGVEVDRPQRQAEIYQFKRTSEPVLNEEKQTLSWKFEVECGKGTYVRTLAVDTGLKLGFAAHMSDLTRTESGGFRVKDCLTLEQVANFMEKDDLSFLHPIEQAVSMFERLDVSDELYQNTLKNGGFLTISDFDLADQEGVIAIFHRERLVSLYQKHPTKPLYLKPIRVLRND